MMISSSRIGTGTETERLRNERSLSIEKGSAQPQSSVSFVV